MGRSLVADFCLRSGGLVVVCNCSDQVVYLMMQRHFKGLLRSVWWDIADGRFDVVGNPLSYVVLSTGGLKASVEEISILIEEVLQFLAFFGRVCLSPRGSGLSTGLGLHTKYIVCFKIFEADPFKARMAKIKHSVSRPYIRLRSFTTPGLCMSGD